MGEERVTYKELDQFLKKKNYYGMFPDRKFIQNQLQDPYFDSISYEGVQREGWKMFLRKMMKRGNQWEQLHQKKEQKKENIKTLYSGMENENDADDRRVSFIESEDKLELKLILHKPVEEEGPLTENDMWKLLAKSGIVYGVKESFIKRLAERPVYEKRFKIGKGDPPGTGKDGKVTYYFDTESSLVPSIGEDGKADYKSLNYVKTIHKGDLLCEIIPPTRGKDGKGLDGVVIPGIEGKREEVSPGKNTLLSPDKKKIYASCDGYPVLEKGVVYVCEFLRVENVDNTTGNIEFVGSVHVSGDVLPGFKVFATDDIIVDGVVEGSLKAGRNAILRNGMKGADREYLFAGRDIRVDFIENTQVLVRKNLYADVIMNCKVECWENIYVYGRRGRLMGGEYWAGNKIEADEIGNDANIYTALKLFPSVGEERRKKNYLVQIKAVTDMINGISKVLEGRSVEDDNAWKIMVVRASYLLIFLERYLLEWQQQMVKMQEWNRRNRQVIVREALHSNVYVDLNSEPFRNRRERYGKTRIYTQGGSVKVITEGIERDD